MRIIQTRGGGPSGAAAESGFTAGVPAGSARRHGISSVLAMLYLVLFSTLALGFYAQVNIAGQVSSNEARAASAQLAAESGYHFTRYQLSNIDVPMTLPADKQWKEVMLGLSLRLDGTQNLGGGVVAYDDAAGHFPAQGYVRIDSEQTKGFRVDLSRSGDQMVAKFTGVSARGQFARAIELKFAKVPKVTTIFNYGVASRGSISTSGAATIKGLSDPTKGSILSTSAAATPVTINGKAVSGDIGMTNPKGSASLGSNVSVGGTTNTSLIYKDHVHAGAPEPRFPDVDTSIYATYAKNTYAPGMTVLDNCRVPAGVTCSLSGGAVIRGVLYLEKGASLRCGGGVTVQAVIAAANDCPLDLANNVIEFGGSVTALPVKDLPASFGDVRTLTGAFIIAPAYRVRLWGSFGTVAGTIICGQYQMGGSAEGTIVGSIIQMQDVPMTISGSADVIIAGTGTTEYPPGVTFGASYASLPGTYTEVAP